MGTALWRQGFEAGRTPWDCRCPYPARTPEARSWLTGWCEGLQAFLGRRHEACPPDATDGVERPVEVETPAPRDAPGLSAPAQS